MIFIFDFRKTVQMYFLPILIANSVLTKIECSASLSSRVNEGDGHTPSPFSSGGQFDECLIRIESKES